ncbi:MAG: hypothetical protein ACRCUY_13625, partial [Thermoguttaceae bacterium]
MNFRQTTSHCLCSLLLPIGFALLFFGNTSFLSAQTELKHQSWSGAQFPEMETEVAQNEDFNFLTFPGAKIEKVDGVSD